jgi:hypothetical protein
MGIKSRPLLYLRARSMPHIKENESGLLPTPMAQSRETTPEQTIERQKKYGGKTRAMYLENFAVMGMLPTPIAGDWKGQRRSDGTASMLSGKASLGLLPTPTTHQQNTQFKQGVTCLQAKLTMGLLFTPKANDFKNQSKGEKWKGLDLSSQVKELTGTNSRLNHQFVAEMMGFPANWTELPFLSGETKVSKPTEMP